MATIDVKDALGATVAIEKPLAPNRAAATASRPVVLCNEDFAVIDGLETALAALGTQTTLAAILAKIIAAPATEATLATIAGYLDTVEAKLQTVADDIVAATISTVAHDAPAAGVNPILQGGYASDTAPAPVDTNTDAVRAWFLRNGARATSLVGSTPPAATTMQSGATANGNGTNLPVTGFAVAILNVVSSVAMSGGTTINFEASVDDTTFVPILAHQVGAIGALSATTTVDGDFRINVAGYKSIRARISAYSAGTITVKGYPSVVSAQPTTVSLAGLGQTTKAASVPVAVATDQNGLSNRAISAVFTTLTRAANITAYAAGDSISDNATPGSVTALSATVSDVNDDPIFLSEILVTSTDTGLAGKRIRAYVYNADPTASSGVVGGDNLAFSNKKNGYIGSFSGRMEAGFSDGTPGRLVPSFQLAADTTDLAGAPAGGFIPALPTSGAKTLYIQFQAIDAFTPSANSTTIIARAKGWQARAA